MNKKNSVIDIPADRWIVSQDSVFSSHYMPDTVCSTRAGIIENFNFSPDDFNIDNDLLTQLDPLHKMVLEAGKAALSDCFHTMETREKTGVIIASIALPTQKSSDIAWQICMENNPRPLTKKDAMAASVVSVPAALVARAFGLKGGCFTLDAACASSLFSIKLACDELLTRKCDMMIAGGISRADSLYTQIGFTQLKALSPSGKCSPFDKNADGLVVGEGVGLVVLKRLDDAVKCGDKIYGIICGTGLSNDIEGSLVTPASEGQIRAMRTAFKNAGWLPKDVQFVECHGSGTPVGDNIELNSMKTLWEEAGCHDEKCSIGSIKSMTGHLLTGAGAAGMIKTLLGMNKKILPPSINFFRAPENSPLNFTNFTVQTEPDEWRPGKQGGNNDSPARRAGVSAFGFGGINAHILVEEYIHGNAKKYFPKPGKKDRTSGKTEALATTSEKTAADDKIPIAVVGMEVITGSAGNLKEFQDIIFGKKTNFPKAPGKRWRITEERASLLIEKNNIHTHISKPETKDFVKNEKKSEYKNINGYWIRKVSSSPGEFHIPPNGISDLLPQHLIMLKAAKKALENAGIPARPKGKNSARTKFGAAIGIEFDYEACDFHLRWKSMASNRHTIYKPNETEGNSIAPELTPGRTLGALGGIVASRIAREFQLGGPCFTISSGNSSGIKAIEVGINSLRSGETDIFLCGSVDMAGDVRQTLINHIIKPFAEKPLTYTQNKKKEKGQLSMSPAFDKNAKGSVPSEGAAAIILKTLDQAKKDGDRIYAIIKNTAGSSGSVMAFESEIPPSLSHNNNNLNRTTLDEPNISNGKKSSNPRSIFQFTIENPCSTEKIYNISLKNAISNSKIQNQSIGLYQAHGSGNRQEDMVEAKAINKYFDKKSKGALPCAIGSSCASIGDTKAVSGLLSIITSCLALYHKIIPPLSNFTSPAYKKWKQKNFYIPKFPCLWIKDNDKDKRCACVASITDDGACAHAIIEEYNPNSIYSNSKPTNKKDMDLNCEKKYQKNTGIYSNEDPISKNNVYLNMISTGFFLAEGNSQGEVIEKLESLKFLIKENKNIIQCAEIWFNMHRQKQEYKFCTAIISKDTDIMAERLIPKAIESVKNKRQVKINEYDNGIYYTPNPIGKKGKTAFLYPGSGNHFPGMGRQIGILFPEIFHSMEDRNIPLRKCLLPEIYYPMRISWEKEWEKDAFDKIKSHSHNMIFGQVLFGSIMTKVAEKFKIKPNAAIGHSLGETASLFALNVWDNPVEMLERMEKSDLFTKKLAGDFTEAAKIWKLPKKIKPKWGVAAVNRSKKDIEKLIKNYDRLYILIINAPNETIIGGDHNELNKFIRDTECGAMYLDGVVSVHCEIANSVRDEYLNLHKFNCHPPSNIDFYSCALGKKYIPETMATATSILNQAIYGFDYNLLINTAWNDGIRTFIEIGPNSSCTRLVDKILKEKDHLALSFSSKNEDEELSILKALAILACHRINLDLSPLFNSDLEPKGAEPLKIHNKQTKRNEDFNAKKTAIDLVPGRWQLNTLPDDKHYEKDQDEFRTLKQKAHNNIKKDNIMGDCSKGIENTSFNYLPGIKLHSDANSQAHEKFLDLTKENMLAFEKQFKALTKTAKALAESLPDSAGISNRSYTDNGLYHDDVKKQSLTPKISPLFTKEMCMEFATGSAAAVLGEKFKIIDSYPVRVRLPDAPLMLVDRIIKIKGEMLSLKSGTIITQHDVKKNAWYLDGGRAPVSISIEAGQADLFLCSWLGIDHAVKGKRRYRLLDAKVTFHRPLPVPGETIEYRITIDRFLRQGEIYLFFFHYKGYINNELLISMRDGCAGFFTEQEIKNSIGIVLKKTKHTTAGISKTPSQTKIAPSSGMETKKYVENDIDNNWHHHIHTGTKYHAFTPLVRTKKERYNDEQIEALRRGDAEKCFGRPFKGILLGKNLRLPGGKMHLIDRVTELDPKGGKFNLGFISAEADIKPDMWFLTCHFIDDKVMPGTLMYECCAHTLRIFTQRMGWVSKRQDVYYDIIPGIESDLKCRGPVTPETKKAKYEIEIKQMGYNDRNEPFVIADAHMFADDHRIVLYKNMGMKIIGLLPEELKNLWGNQTNLY